MRPELVEITLFGFHLQLFAYPLFLTTSAVTVLWLTFWLTAKKGLPRNRVLVCLAGAVVATLIGARLLHAGLNWGLYKENPGRFFSLHLENFSLYGGFILAALSGIFTTRMLRLDSWQMVDIITPCLGVGVAIAKIGCFMEGHSFGRVTSLPWGVVFPRDSAAQAYQASAGMIELSQMPLPVHPTQLYELIAAILAAALAAWFLRRKMPSGYPFLAAAVLFSAFRMLNSQLRVPASTLDVPTWWPVVFYGSIIIICSGLLIWRSRVAL